MPETPRRATINDDVAPDEMTPAKARELLDAAADDGRVLGLDPLSGNEIIAKAGRYGPYVTEVLPETETDDAAPKRGKAAAKAKPRTASLFKDMDLATIDLDAALQLLSLPRVVGTVAEEDGTSVDITAQNGRYGPYLKKGTDSRSLATEQQLFDDHPRRGARDLRPAEAARPRRRGSAQGARHRPGVGQGGDGQGRPVRALRHRRRDQRDAATGRRARVDHARARVRAAGGEAGQGPDDPQAGGEEDHEVDGQEDDREEGGGGPVRRVDGHGASVGPQGLTAWRRSTRRPRASSRPGSPSSSGRSGCRRWPPGSSAAVTWSGRTRAARSTAAPTGWPPTADTQYRIGSITKTFVAVCVMRLRDAGRLDLDDRFEDHVPGSAFGRATIAQLLTHTSGLQSETDGPWWERTPGGDWAALMASVAGAADARRRAGTTTRTSAMPRWASWSRGPGASPWVDVVQRDLLDPLGMTRTTPRPAGKAAVGLAVHPFADLLLAEPEHDAGAMAPAGQLWSTVDDLARWAAFLGGDTGDILAKDTLEEMCVVQAVNDLPGQAWLSGHGLGWQVWNVDGRRYAGHGGSMPGFLAGLQVDVETGDGVVIFSNTTSGPLAFARDLLTLVREREPVAAGDLVCRWLRPRRGRDRRSVALGSGRHDAQGDAATGASSSGCRGRVAGRGSGRRPTAPGSASRATTRGSRWSWSGTPTAP